MDDFEYYKAALARWSARNNFLIDKYVKKVLSICTDIGFLEKDYPSSSDKAFIEVLRKKSAIYEEFIKDLKAPAFSDLDFKADRDSFETQSKKRVDAIQIELLDGDYVHQSL